jgi:hypothetical protein
VIVAQKVGLISQMLLGFAIVGAKNVMTNSKYANTLAQTRLKTPMRLTKCVIAVSKAGLTFQTNLGFAIVVAQNAGTN